MDKDINKNKKVKSNNFKTFGKILLLLFAGFSIYLFISTIMLIFLTMPEKEITVPHVVGKQFVDVYNSLMRKGIKPELKFKDVYDLDNGIILNQYPKKGKIISENSNLKLVISRSTFFIDVPNLVGTELPIAINKLKNLHYHDKVISISVGVISYVPSEKSANNIVINQSPKSGQKITPSMKINLLVSVGSLKSDNKMPNVTGQSINLCYDMLKAKGAIIRQEIVKTAKISDSGLVISQSPKKGSRIKNNDVIKLKVKWYSLKEHPYIAYERIDYKIPNDLKKGLYEAYIEDNHSKRIRFTKKMKPVKRFLLSLTGLEMQKYQYQKIKKL